MRYLIIATDTDNGNATVYYEGAGGWTTRRNNACRYTASVIAVRIEQTQADYPGKAEQKIIAA